MTFIQARYVTMSGIAFPQAGAAMLQEAMQHRSGLVESKPGFGALQVWRSLRTGDPHRMVTWWTDEQAFSSYKGADVPPELTEQCHAHQREAFCVKGSGCLTARRSLHSGNGVGSLQRLIGLVRRGVGAACDERRAWGLYAAEGWPRPVLG